MPRIGEQEMGQEMPIPSFLNFSELSAEPLPPALSSLYLWDTCRHGKLFHTESYSMTAIQNWMKGLVDSSISSVILPERFSSDRVAKLLKNKILEAFSDSRFSNLFSSLDAENVQSIDQLIRESAEEERKGFENLIQFLRQDEFPPILWLEIGRYDRFSADVMEYLHSRMEKLASLRPKMRAEVMRRSKQAWSMGKVSGILSTNLTNAFLEVFGTFLFLELWSCEKEEELFGEKSWTFRNVDPLAFEDRMFRLHSSIDVLSNTFFDFRSSSVHSDFTEPIGWAFKQLVQTA